MTILSHPSKIYLKPFVNQDTLQKYGFKLLKEQWRGGSSVVYLTIQNHRTIYHGGKYEFYHFDGLGLCECFELLWVEAIDKSA